MKYSPGFLLRCMAIEKGIAEGMVVYDMGRGHEAYKTNDFKCKSAGNWLIRATNQSTMSRVKFKVFLWSELLGKIPKRLRRDYQDFRRFSMTRKPSISMVISFLGLKGKEVMNLFAYNLSRFLHKAEG